MTATCDECGGPITFDDCGPVCLSCRAKAQQQCCSCGNDHGEPRYWKGIYYSRLCGKCWREARKGLR
jgi:hypothetical protein